MNYPATRVTAGENAQQRLHAHLTIPFAMIRRHRVTFARLLTLRHDQDDPDMIDETIRGFNMIMDGELDNMPEAAFNLVGTIDDAIAKGKKMMEEAAA